MIGEKININHLINLIGKKIEIIHMDGEPQYTGKQGVVTRIDDMCQIHGTWGRCALIEDCDQFKIIEELIEEQTIETPKMKPFDEWEDYEFALITPNDEWHYFKPKTNTGAYDEAMKLINSYEDGVDLYIDPDEQDANHVVSFCDGDGYVYSPTLPDAIRYLCDLPLIVGSKYESLNILIDEGIICDVYSFEDFKREYNERMVDDNCHDYEEAAIIICDREGIEMPEISSEWEDYVSIDCDDFVDDQRDYYYESDENILWYIG